MITCRKNEAWCQQEPVASGASVSTAQLEVLGAESAVANELNWEGNWAGPASSRRDSVGAPKTHAYKHMT